MSVPLSHHARLLLYFSHFKSFCSRRSNNFRRKTKFVKQSSNYIISISKHLIEVKNKKMTYEKFIDIYGHIRPNNYDLISNNISEKGEDFINFLIDNIESSKQNNADIKNSLQNIDNYLIKNNYQMSLNNGIVCLSNQ